ncbi:MAG: monovalent cation/H(+) antiporter subunit G [Azovibrio sp.]|nr:monovalent cation/H(+) antiporter subunit G [Azovibrio sp.]
MSGMNHWENLPLWAGLPAALLLILGGGIALIGCLGLMRLPHFYQRIHGPAITITLGTSCILIASMLLFSAQATRPVVHELLITLFVLMTAPMVSMLIMRAAVHRELRKPPPNPPRAESAWNVYGDLAQRPSRTPEPPEMP